MNDPTPVPGAAIDNLSKTTIAVLALRSAGFAADLFGRTRIADYLFALADGVESGRNVDEGMAAVAALLKDRKATDADWVTTMERLGIASEDLQSPRSP